MPKNTLQGIIDTNILIQINIPIHIVSGDADLHVLKNKIKGIKIVAASEFLKLII